ncbi:MAG: hypothetical protein IT361_06390 [Gemmatimonadaceae bacterium]|nr:hypothetical protein [Gemmatimonadaceae bacterium]
MTLGLLLFASLVLRLQSTTTIGIVDLGEHRAVVALDAREFALERMLSCRSLLLDLRLQTCLQTPEHSTDEFSMITHRDLIKRSPVFWPLGRRLTRDPFAVLNDIGTQRRSCAQVEQVTLDQKLPYLRTSTHNHAGCEAADPMPGVPDLLRHHATAPYRSRHGNGRADGRRRIANPSHVQSRSSPSNRGDELVHECTPDDCQFGMFVFGQRLG